MSGRPEDTITDSSKAKSSKEKKRKSSGKTPEGKRTKQQGNGARRGPRSNENKAPKKKGRIIAPTVSDILSDELTKLGLEYWTPIAGNTEKKPFNPQLIEDIYFRDLRKGDIQRIMLLEVGRYLENYLWKNWDEEKSSMAHTMSIVMMVNEKFRENVHAWDCFHTREAVFPAFFSKALKLKDDYDLTYEESSQFLVFLINCFQSLEDAMVREQVEKLVSIKLWHSVNPLVIERETSGNKKLARFWKKELKSAEGEDEDSLERTFMPNLLEEFFQVLDGLQGECESASRVGLSHKAALPRDQIHFCERIVELMVDLLSQLPTRRFFRPLFEDVRFVTRCKMSRLANSSEGILFGQFLDFLRFYENFEVDDFTGHPLTEEDVAVAQCARIRNLQRVIYKHFPDKKDLAFSPISTFQSPETFRKHLKGFTPEELNQLCELIGLQPPAGVSEELSEEFLTNSLVSLYQRRMSQISAINEMAIYPNEGLLWNDNVIPSDDYNGDQPLALPKLNLQFLTFHDYLLRNYDLYRLESAYQIRMDIEDAVRRMDPRKEVVPSSNGRSESVKTVFGGWSRMALALQDFSITSVGDPKLGESRPSQVLAEAFLNYRPIRHPQRQEWEDLKVHDVVFLVTVRAPVFPGEPIDTSLPIRDQIGIQYVRGATVLQVYDEENNLIREMDRFAPRAGHTRKFRLQLDAAQYQQDLDNEEDVYGTFNLFVRRRPKENNFRAVLETIRDMMNTNNTTVPKWLNDIFLGYEDPKINSARNTGAELDFNDTFLDVRHLVDAFPEWRDGKEGKKFVFLDPEGHEVQTEEALGDPTATRIQSPFKLKFSTPPEGGKTSQVITVKSYVPPLPGPYPYNVPKKNVVPFTGSQIDAIERGMFEGLTLVVGPPGTGKTDVAVQLINNWYHSFPDQRILIVTHSNQALNQIFEKIMALDIDHRHLLRLGHGQDMLDTEADFSKYGRVNHMLARRLELLERVDKLARSLDVVDDVAHGCEMAEQFYRAHVVPKVNQYKKKVKEPEFAGKTTALSALFPFHKFFADAPRPFLEGKNFQEDKRVVEGCFLYIENTFTELRECRAFELLRSSGDRSNYLLTKQARIVAMTCTHAAVKRSELVSLGFKYDNLIMEEAAQILEIETFIPMLLQESRHGDDPRLKRVVLIGDHHQLPPVVKNVAFQKYSHLDQSLFTRFVRLGLPTVQLDAQGRARPSLAELYNWRYKTLVNLPNTISDPKFQLANAGLRYDYQLIDVGDYDGRGESTPNPHFFQNLGEAEYVVAVYMYLRLLGYPANSIAILTTYNGQKHLIRDVFRARTGWTKFYGQPQKITTVDRYQGQQADYILLSLVRTKAVGHLRDVRRLVVAMSRARLGLFVFGRRDLFENCYELTPTFSKFRTRPNQLVLVQNEEYPSTRGLEEMSEDKPVHEVKDVIEMGTIIASMQNNMQDKMKEEHAMEEDREEERRKEEKAFLDAQKQRAQEEMQAEAELAAKMRHLEDEGEECVSIDVDYVEPPTVLMLGQSDVKCVLLEGQNWRWKSIDVRMAPR
ncbi:intron-binding protein aquarius-like [Planoprotostelium fungivorum]|uniref:Intron-binding protein aquarius-like n=1 Tax=Planoprotostelium fungivorum TaxID=1890364 RepID=A0A2P6NTK9_9EUKA|nr:intron-binding protein aquarius-like [Planoprotostelium fungivorum]